VKHILDTVVANLMANPDRKFIYVEQYGKRERREKERRGEEERGGEEERRRG
jgi:hypothetical protein